jgi:hypothetical protein
MSRSKSLPQDLLVDDTYVTYIASLEFGSVWQLTRLGFRVKIKIRVHCDLVVDFSCKSIGSEEVNVLYLVSIENGVQKKQTKVILPPQGEQRRGTQPHVWHAGP